MNTGRFKYIQNQYERMQCPWNDTMWASWCLDQMNSNILRSWWRHQMKTFFALLAICAGNSPVNSSHKDQWPGALMFSLIWAWVNHRVNTGEIGDLKRYRAHYDVIVMW